MSVQLPEAGWFAPPSELAFTDADCDAILAAAGDWEAVETEEQGRHGRPPNYQVAQIVGPSVDSIRLALTQRAAGFADAIGVPFPQDARIWVQLLRYEPGSGIGWHRDRVAGHPVFDRCFLAVSVALSSPDEYRGGVLEVMFEDEVHAPARERGTVALYTDQCLHRVSPVTLGTRYALVAFFLEPDLVAPVGTRIKRPEAQREDAGGDATVGLSFMFRDHLATTGAMLDSVLPFVGEVVAVDTGSCDRTRQLVEQRLAAAGVRCEIVDFEWVDDFAAGRQAGFDRLQSAWGMWIDVDEVLVGGEFLRGEVERAHREGLALLECRQVTGGVLSLMSPRVVRLSVGWEWQASPWDLLVPPRPVRGRKFVGGSDEPWFDHARQDGLTDWARNDQYIRASIAAGTAHPRIACWPERNWKWEADYANLFSWE